MNAGELRTYIAERVCIEDRGHSTLCWIWQLSKNKKGYGRCHRHGQNWRVHRLSYIVHIGQIPAGLDLDHLCRVTACCNPEHLEPITNAENKLRARPLKTHCNCGTELTPENRYKAQCKKCRADRKRAWDLENRAHLKAKKSAWRENNRELVNARKRALRASRKAA